MILVDTALQKREAEGKPIRVGMASRPYLNVTTCMTQ